MIDYNNLFLFLFIITPCSVILLTVTAIICHFDPPKQEGADNPLIPFEDDGAYAEDDLD